MVFSNQNQLCNCVVQMCNFFDSLFIDCSQVLLWKTESCCFGSSLSSTHLDSYLLNLYWKSEHLIHSEDGFFDSWPVGILRNLPSHLHNLVFYHGLLRYICSSGEYVWHFKLCSLRIACLIKLVMILCCLLNVLDFSENVFFPTFFCFLLLLLSLYIASKVIQYKFLRLHQQQCTIKANNQV